METATAQDTQSPPSHVQTLSAPTRHRVVVVGGGIAGLDIVSTLAKQRTAVPPLSVTLIDREPAYVWKPMLHTIAAGTSTAALQETVYAALALDRGFDFQFGEASGIDRTKREVTLAPIAINGETIVAERQITYDTLIVAVGSRANDFGVPGVQEHCLPIDTRAEAIRFNDRLRVNLIRAAATGQPLTVGIVGGGATGVELAASLTQVAVLAERHGVPRAASHLRIVLIETEPRLLRTFPEDVGAATMETLKGLGVDVRLGVGVASVDPQGLTLVDGTVLETGMTVWAAGVRAPPFLDMLDGLERTRSGQLVVDGSLRTTRDASIIAIGDCASAKRPGHPDPMPPTAQAATQQANYICAYLPDLIVGKPVPPADYRHFGAVVSLGEYGAYGSLARFGFFKGGLIRGRFAQFGHAMLYRGFQSRVHGFWKGSLLWLVDVLGRRVRPSGRLS